MTNRKTSLYTIEIPASRRDAALGQVISRLPVPLQGSGLRLQGSYVQFRAKDDTEASEVARTAAGDLKVVLRTGLGAHARFISLEPADSDES